LQAWAVIKKPYRELMNLLLSVPAHVLLCGRQGIDYGEDEASGELKSLGYRMRAEGETSYEPDVLLRLESYRPGKKKPAIPVAHVEKNRTGVLAGQTIEWLRFENIAQPLLELLGTVQVVVPSDEEVGVQDAEALARQEAERIQRSGELAGAYTARFADTDTLAGLELVGRELTAPVKQRFVPKDLERVRRAYAQRLAQLKRPPDGQTEENLPIDRTACPS
jgi:hypothetical protein